MNFTLVDRRIDERLWFRHYIMIGLLTDEIKCGIVATTCTPPVPCGGALSRRKETLFTDILLQDQNLTTVFLM